MLKRILTGTFFLLLTAFGAEAHAADLVVYSSGPGSLAKSLAKIYEAKTGRPVQLYVASTGKVMARLAAEAGNPHADVVILADWTAGLALAKAGMVKPYRPMRIERRLRRTLNAQGPFLPVGGDIVGLVANTDAVSGREIPHDWFDLTQPRWKDKLTMPDPTLSGTASDFVIAFVSHYGEAGWRFFEGLKRNGTLWPGPNAAALRPVESGERAMMVAAVGHTAIKAKLAGNTLDLILPKGGAVLIPRPILIMKSSHEIKSAEQFIDLAFTPAGQKAVAKALLLPAVREIKPADVWPNLAGASLLPVDWAQLSLRRKAVLARFTRQILGR